MWVNFAFLKDTATKKKGAYIDISFTCMFLKLRLDWLYVEFYFRVYLSVVRKSPLGEVGLLCGDAQSTCISLLACLCISYWRTVCPGSKHSYHTFKSKVLCQQLPINFSRDLLGRERDTWIQGPNIWASQYLICWSLTKTTYEVLIRCWRFLTYQYSGCELALYFALLGYLLYKTYQGISVPMNKTNMMRRSFSLFRTCAYEW